MYSVTFLTGMMLLYSITLCLTIPIAKDQRIHLAWHKDRFTLLLIMNMDGSVIGKFKRLQCLAMYRMQVHASVLVCLKDAWMTGEIHHRIMTQLKSILIMPWICGHNQL